VAERRRGPDYAVARVGAAAALTAVLIILLIVDASTRDYELQPFTLTALLTAILTLLGLEARNQIALFRREQQEDEEDDT